MINRTTLASLLLIAGLVSALPSLAAGPGNCGPMGGWEDFHGQRAERMEQHQKKLHDALKLTADQEGAWKTFTASMHGPAKADRPDREELSKLTTPERAEKMLDLAKQHQERMAEHVAALKTFYGVLTPEQKKIFDEQHAFQHGARHGTPPAGGNATPPAQPAQPAAKG